MLKYPKEPIIKKKVIESKKINYEDLLQEQNRKIRIKKEKQNITLRNINYELLKLNEFNKQINYK